MFKRKKSLSVFEDLHTCKACEGCNFYKLERDICAFSAYCYYPNNWKKVLMCSTEEDADPFESPMCEKAPDEINFNNECEWRNDDCEPFSGNVIDIIDRSSEEEE